MREYIEREADKAEEKMPEYIERKALNVEIHESWQSNPHNNPIARQTHNHEHRHFLSLLHKQPTADVAEVVRCKDCRYWGGVIFGYVCRRFSGATLRNETRENDFCSFGAKMDGKGECE